MIKFELLPNEILIECFQYLNAFDLFHSFDQLNDRFNKLIRNIPLCINLNNVKKSIFDEFCTKMLLNPKIQSQIYALYFPLDEYDYVQYVGQTLHFQTHIFQSFFSQKEFFNLQKYGLILPPPTRRIFYWPAPPKVNFIMELSDTSFPKLRTLSAPYLYEWDKDFENTLFLITNLTLTRCTLDDFYCLLKFAPMLKYLHTVFLYHWEETKEEFFDGISNSNIKQWIIDDFRGTIDDFEMFIKYTPNLKSLTIDTNYNEYMIDADKWEQLITSSLPYLNVFKFYFCERFSNDEQNSIIKKFLQFQTSFWQEQHQWFTEYVIKEDLASIYTIPYPLETYNLQRNCRRYCNSLKSNINTFINVTDLTLHRKSITEHCEYYFSNVISLELTTSNSESLTIEHIEHLKMIVNLFNLKHLNIWFVPDMKDPSVLLEIFKYASQLFSLTIHWHQLISFLEDSELCKYLNKMIKTLNIWGESDSDDDEFFEVEQFCEIFSNIEHLQCVRGFARKLLSFLNHLPKLSTLQLQWQNSNNPEWYLREFENKIRKQDAIYIIDTGRALSLRHQRIYYGVVCIWFGNNIP